MEALVLTIEDLTVGSGPPFEGLRHHRDNHDDDADDDADDADDCSGKFAPIFFCGFFDLMLSIMKVFEGRDMLCYLIELSLPHPPAERGWTVFVFSILYSVFC